MQKQVSVVLIDDNPSALEGVAARIRTEPGFRVLASSAEVEVALENVRNTRPDVVILNVLRPGSDGLTVAGDTAYDQDLAHDDFTGRRIVVYQDDRDGFLHANHCR